MISHNINKEKFKFQYLPEYADYLLKNKLDEFVLIGIRFFKDENLPILNLPQFKNLSEEELVALSVTSNREMLEALSSNEIADYIAKNAKKWIANTLGIIDKTDIAAEDLTLVFFVRRKIFGYFLDNYTKNIVEQKFIINEVDAYTTQEELLSYNVFLKILKEKI